MLKERKINETLTRPYRPFELELAEVTSDGELVYLEQIGRSFHKNSPFVKFNSYILDKRQLGPHQFTFRKYVFNIDSIFMQNYLFLNERTRFIFLFRRINTCRHKFSCIESILRRFYQAISLYTSIRVPLQFLIQKCFPNRLEFLCNKYFLAAEIFLLLTVALIRAGGGCLIRYMHEEVMMQPLHHSIHRHDNAQTGRSQLE
jgi:hypothetical protein